MVHPMGGQTLDAAISFTQQNSNLMK